MLLNYIYYGLTVFTTNNLAVRDNCVASKQASKQASMQASKQAYWSIIKIFERKPGYLCLSWDLFCANKGNRAFAF